MFGLLSAVGQLGKLRAIGYRRTGIKLRVALRSHRLPSLFRGSVWIYQPGFWLRFRSDSKPAKQESNIMSFNHSKRRVNRQASYGQT